MNGATELHSKRCQFSLLTLHIIVQTKKRVFETKYYPLFLQLMLSCEVFLPENKIKYTVLYSGGSSVGQNKLLQLILGYIYILKYLQSNFIG